MITLKKTPFMFFLISSIAFDTALSLQPDLNAYSNIFKGGLMVIFMIPTVALLLRKSTYASIDILALLLLTVIFIYYSALSEFPADSMNRALKQLFLVSIYSAAIYYLHYSPFRRKDLVNLTIVCLMISSPAALFLTFNPRVDHVVQDAAPYTVLSLLMLSFLVAKNNNRFLIVLMLLASFVLMTIMKRGAILTLALIIIYWSILQNFYFPRGRTFAKTLFWAVVSALVISVFWFVRGDDFILRLQDYSGSGRDLIYMSILQGIIDSNTAELLFGHGSMAVQILTGQTIGVRESAKFGLQSHNDWLTLSYDFGLFGIFLFVIFHFAIYKKIQAFKKIDTSLYVKLKPIHLAIIAISFFSEILFNTSLIFIYVLLAITSSPAKFSSAINAR